MLEITPKPENQPYAMIFRVHKQTKEMICLHGKQFGDCFVVCSVRLLMNDTPSTGKSTLCCNITTNNQNQTKQNKYLFAWKTILRLFVAWKNDTPSTKKSTLCHNSLITQQTKISFLHENCLYVSRSSACARRSRVSRGLAPGGGWKGAASPCLRKFCIWWAKMHNLVPFLPIFLSKFIVSFFVCGWVGVWGLRVCVCVIERGHNFKSGVGSGCGGPGQEV